MRLIQQSERDMIRSVADRWKTQWRHLGYKMDARVYHIGSRMDKSRKQILDELQTLDTETCSKKEVDDIIGNESWTRGDTCNECKRPSDILIQVGEEPDYESRTASICPECLKAAMSLIP